MEKACLNKKMCYHNVTAKCVPLNSSGLLTFPREIIKATNKSC